MIIWLQRLTRWLIDRWILEDRIVLPVGMDPSDIRFRWIGAGTPFWRLIDDSKGYQVAVANGFTSPEEVAAEHGGNFFANVDALAYDLEYARKRGIVLPFDPVVLGKTNTGL